LIAAKLGDTGNQLFDEHALTKRVFALQVLVHEILVDHGYFDCGCGVLIAKRASRDELNAKGIEIIRSDHAEAGVRTLRRIRVGSASIQHERHAKSPSIWRLAGHRSGVLHTRNSRNVGENVAIVG
jgi:hypothetical protein